MDGVELEALVDLIAPDDEDNNCDLVEKLLDAGIVRPSTSPWSSPVIPADGSIRLVVDYRAVNRLTQVLCPDWTSCWLRWERQPPWT